MKALFKILLVFAVVMASLPSEAQILTRHVLLPKKDSAIDATGSFLTFTSTANGLTGVSLTAVKGTGTPAGYAILQVRTDTIPTGATSSWIDYVNPVSARRDTLFFTNVTVQGYQWPVPVQFFNGVRAKIVPSGTQKTYLYFSTLRR